MHRSKFVHQTQVLSAEISRYLCFCNEFSRDAFGREHENGTFAAGLPGIHDVNLVIHPMGKGSSPRRWSRGPCKAEKPTQRAPARAQNPAPAAKMAPSGAHSAKNAQVSSWRTRPITWPSRRTKLALLRAPERALCAGVTGTSDDAAGELPVRESARGEELIVGRGAELLSAPGSRRRGAARNGWNFVP